jgi:antirestriction protein ArdC
MTHWSGHESRLNRLKKGNDEYAFEELIAEIGAAFLCAEFSIPSVERGDHAAYVSHWIKALKASPKMLFDAAARASNAVEFMKSNKSS